MCKKVSWSSSLIKNLCFSSFNIWKIWPEWQTEHYSLYAFLHTMFFAEFMLAFRILFYDASCDLIIIQHSILTELWELLWELYEFLMEPFFLSSVFLVLDRGSFFFVVEVLFFWLKRLVVVVLVLLVLEFFALVLLLVLWLLFILKKKKKHIHALNKLINS